jgi:hypothetical protein
MAADRTVSRAAYLCIAAFGVNVLNCRGQGVGLRAAIFVTFPRKRFVHDFTSRFRYMQLPADSAGTSWERPVMRAMSYVGIIELTAGGSL